MTATESNCIFCKIVRGEIPCKQVYGDDQILAFHDIQPVAPVHVLIVPKKHIATLYDATMDDAPVLGKMLAMAPGLARKQGAQDGFRTIINTGRVALQEVQHLHVHVIGGPDSLGRMIPRKET
ncbi:MAG: histidine triad nucleotide-binding protein [Betaproteobacteria bacterium]|nr:histidine triad nucleotide-binding protein [Betaproteobacteria bacterium]MBA3776050.1 histidine triad nucleotide-binding protein [Betaproteobacteria bacterium]